MSTPSSSAVRALALEYKSLQEEPVEGFRVKLLNDDNLFEWEVAIFGPPDTLYQGGYFKVSINQTSYFFHLLHLLFSLSYSLDDLVLKSFYPGCVIRKRVIFQRVDNTKTEKGNWLVYTMHFISNFSFVLLFFSSILDI